MFGFVNANTEALSEESKKTYSAYYCGLCNAIKRRYGEICRITLNYDLTFLAVFLSAVFGEKEEKKESLCGPHPLKKHTFLESEIIDYCADMNILMSYFKLLDDKSDDKNPFSGIGAEFLRKKVLKYENKYSKKIKIIKNYLYELNEVEKKNILVPDIPSQIFGKVMGELFSYKECNNSEILYNFGCALGEFIYIADASIDLKKDLNKQNYNPLILTPREDFPVILNMLMGECTDIYKKINITKNKEIIDNILFSGIWTKVNLYNSKNKRGTKK